MGKEPIVSVTYENERISIKNSLPYLKCVLRLSCVVHGLIYGRFMGFYVNSRTVFSLYKGLPKFEEIRSVKQAVYKQNEIENSTLLLN